MELAVLLGVEERFLSGAVTADEPLLPAGVPQRKGVHTLEELDHRRPVLLVEVDEHLGVSAGGEAVPAAAERLPQPRGL
jgi:hypothetical protein